MVVGPVNIGARVLMLFAVYLADPSYDRLRRRDRVSKRSLGDTTDFHVVGSFWNGIWPSFRAGLVLLARVVYIRAQDAMEL
jgi:hypothetical protein